jgi:hypothetical protein
LTRGGVLRTLFIIALLLEVPLPPEILVLAWALLFVVASGLVFRFFSWLGRRSRARQSSDVVLNGAEDAVFTKAAAPVLVSPPPPAPPAVDGPRTASRSAVGVGVGVADKPAAVTVEPPRPSLRAPLKPNIGATLPPMPPIAATVLQKPSIEATLPPAPVAQVVEPVAEPAAEPVAEPAVEPVAEPAAPAVATALEPAPDLPAPAAFVGRTTLLNSWLLRAWKLGTIAPRLAIRLKESRNRKVVPVPKASRKPPETVNTTVSTKKLKVLAQRSAPDGAPVRRIRRERAQNIRASAQAQTRIVGVPPRRYRVLAANEL